MATFDEFYASLEPDVGIRGKQFEKFVKWFLKTDPTWASQVDEIWLWNEYPKRWGADCGIDLVLIDKSGKTWAVQECRKASYPIGSSKRDWQIFNLILNSVSKKNLFKSFKEIRELSLKEIKNFKSIDSLPQKKTTSQTENNYKFKNEKIVIRDLDYYFSNSISRSSKTMSDCRNLRFKKQFNGREN